MTDWNEFKTRKRKLALLLETFIECLGMVLTAIVISELTTLTLVETLLLFTVGELVSIRKGQER